MRDENETILKNADLEIQRMGTFIDQYTVDF